MNDSKVVEVYLYTLPFCDVDVTFTQWGRIFIPILEPYSATAYTDFLLHPFI